MFNNPGRNGISPKDIEHKRRDGETSDSNTLSELTSDTLLPDGKWETFLKNRTNRSLLCTFLSHFLVDNCKQYLNTNQNIIVASTFKDDLLDNAVEVICNNAKILEELKSNHEEADSQIWLHMVDYGCMSKI